jgi:DNA-binding SARP family transcriptional activator
MSGELRLTMLGAASLTLDGAPVTGFISSKAQALVCYLAATARPQARPALADLLWGELAESDALANLRVALSNMNRLLGSHLVVTRQTVAFNGASRHWIDVAVFEAKTGPATTTSRLQAATALYKGDFLDGLTVRNAPAFDEWLTGRREWLRQRAIQALWRLAGDYIRQEDHAAAIDALTRLLALEPWLEDAHRQLIRLLALGGQRSAALVQYETCRRILRDELGVEPMPETTDLYRRVRLGDIRPNLPQFALEPALEIPA